MSISEDTEDTRPEDSGDDAHFWRTLKSAGFVAIGFVIGLILGHKASSGGEHPLAGWATMGACLIVAYGLSRISISDSTPSTEDDADYERHVFFERTDRDESPPPGADPLAADTSPEMQAKDRTDEFEEWLVADLLDDGDGDPTAR